MKKLYPIARLGDDVLLVNASEIVRIGGPQAMQVMCVQVHLAEKTIDELHSLEEHLKFNAWEEINSEEERAIVLAQIYSMFSDQEIEDKITEPLHAAAFGKI